MATQIPSSVDRASLSCAGPHPHGPIEFDFNPEKINAQLGSPAVVLNATGTDSSGTGTQITTSQSNTARTPKLQFKFYLQGTGAYDMVSSKVMQDALTIQSWTAPTATGGSGGTPPSVSHAGGGGGASQGQSGGNPPAPPSDDYIPVTFQWGSAFSYTGKMTACTVDFLSFDDHGWPLVAAVDVTIQTDNTFQPPQNPTSGGTAPIGAHTVIAGDSLPSIAYSAYGRAGLWRELARVNDIDDPMRVRPGTTLRLPVVNELTEAPGA